MPIATAELVADWGRHVIDRVTAYTREGIGQPIINAVADVQALAHQLLDLAREVPNLIAGLRADIAALPTLTDLTSARGPATHADTEHSAPEAGEYNRVFFSNLGAALASSRAVLSNLPPRNYPMAAPTLPLEELFGQLHAMQANNVQWFRHLENLMTTNDQHLDSQIAGLREHQSKALQGATAALLAEISRIIQAAPTTSTSLDDLLARLGDIAARLPDATTTHALEVLADAINQLQGGSSGSNPPRPDLPPLPPYQATHPTARPRTHGILKFDEVHTRIPMDMTTRPPSTSLEMTLAIRRTLTHTELTAALYDAGALLISKHIRTPHALEDLPGDALALLHRACPAFVYKLSRVGAC